MKRRGLAPSFAFAAALCSCAGIWGIHATDDGAAALGSVGGGEGASSGWPPFDDVDGGVEATLATESGALSDGKADADDGGSREDGAPDGGDVEDSGSNVNPDACAHPTAHNDGEGDTFYACTPLGAYSEALAALACQAYVSTHDAGTNQSASGSYCWDLSCPAGGDAVGLSGGGQCTGTFPLSWTYDNTNVGKVVGCDPCEDVVASWQ